MIAVPLPKEDIVNEWIPRQAVDVLVKDGGTSVCAYTVCVCECFSLESGTVESQCSEGGISDVTAARHTEDL